ncbi:pseudouridine synthase [Novilysobacter spongiicola]|uniref:Pseudouridine synthase n=2 Tax=Novilysobacter TaxID=3382699 RepID=A0A1T4MIA9_9GAMM|nr:pseudouridine synthase [Lysobacter spongiicola]SJZ66692.1 ribosomal large subunit pseudouridine synthase B [Lysobacter spongiicola DSM 21749]
MTEEKNRKLTLKRGNDTGTDAPRMQERLHKVLAQAGLGSRRALEQRIADGLVKVNGEVAQVGMSIGSGDKIELDGRQFVASALTEPSRVLMYNKPEGEVTTRDDPEGRPTIFESLPALKGARWIAIGRLDINTTGLLLLTTDGELANALMHPSFEVEREYVCRVRAPEGEDRVPDNIPDRLKRGVALDDGPAKFDDIERIGGSDSHDWFRVVVKEGRNREVRRLWESQGCQVSRLKRIKYGAIDLPRELLRGQSQELAPDRVEKLRNDLGLEDGAPSALTLQPVIGQRKASKSTIDLTGRSSSQGYVGGHVTAADEGRELRRFDNVREDRGRGRGRPGGGRSPGLTVSGDAAAKQSQKPFKQRKEKGGRNLPEGNPAAFRTWYVPDGVETGPSGHRNADGRGPKKPYGNRGAGPGGGGRPGGGRPGGGGSGRPGAGGGGGGQSQRAPRPYGHPGNAPTFPSDHANPGSFNPYGDKPRSPRPGGKPPGRPGGPRPGGKPGGKPGGNRPGGNKPGGPRGGGRPGGGGGSRGPRGA